MQPCPLRRDMTYETGCGRCGGRLRVEPHSGQVICPHCGMKLNVPEDSVALAGTPTLSPAEEGVLEGHNSSLFDSSALRSGELGIGGIPTPSSIKAPDFTRWGRSDSSVLRHDEPRTNPLGVTPTSNHHAGEPSKPPLPNEIPQKVQPRQDAEHHRPSQPVVPSEPERRAESPAAVSPKPTATRGSRRALIALMIYASAITAICLGLAYFLLMNQQHQLESLPDVVPPRNEDGTITRVIVPPDAPLPAGHILAFGESQRFGDLLVTPLRVEREPLEFVHFRGTETRDPAGEVLKLWLRFENVSEESKSFVPLDENLLFYRTFDKRGGLKANNFLAVGGRSLESRLAVFDHPIGSDWNLAGQNLGTELKPGESVEMYVPTETDPPVIDGRTAWRIHLRKGVASNGWGITTLIEVRG